jgi:phosphopantothenoylcysteine decarboxylase
MLRKKDVEVKTVITERAKSFVAPQALSVMSKNPCYSDADEWNYKENVLHIELAKWCDGMLIAPLTANTLAKISSGLCDNLLTSTVRALGNTPLLLAPAMNTRMWENGITKEQLNLTKRYYNTAIILPIEKNLADGDSGMGALADDETIIKAVLSLNRF